MRIVTPLKETIGFEHALAVFTCRLSNPPHNTAWYKNGRRLRTSWKHVTRNDGYMHTLTISTLDDSDAGTYTFKADDVESSASLCVEVQAPARMCTMYYI